MFVAVAHSENEDAAPTFKRGFGFHLLWAFTDLPDWMHTLAFGEAPRPPMGSKISAATAVLDHNPWTGLAGFGRNGNGWTARSVHASGWGWLLSKADRGGGETKREEHGR